MNVKDSLLCTNHKENSHGSSADLMRASYLVQSFSQNAAQDTRVKFPRFWRTKQEIYGEKLHPKSDFHYLLATLALYLQYKIEDNLQNSVRTIVISSLICISKYSPQHNT